MAPQMQFMQALICPAVNPAGDVESPGQRAAPADIGQSQPDQIAKTERRWPPVCQILVALVRSLTGIFRLADKRQGRGHRGNSDPAVLTIEIGAFVAGAGGLGPFPLSFSLFHCLALPSQPNPHIGRGRKWAPNGTIE